MNKTIMSQNGFTLIEIIAILIILGILAAVAVPRYLDLTAESRKNAAQGAIAELKGRASNIYSSRLLKSDATLYPTGCTNIASALTSSLAATPLGDFTPGTVTTAGCTATPKGIGLSITAVKGVTVTGVSGTWFYPSVD